MRAKKPKPPPTHLRSPFHFHHSRSHLHCAAAAMFRLLFPVSAATNAIAGDSSTEAAPECAASNSGAVISGVVFRRALAVLLVVLGVLLVYNCADSFRFISYSSFSAASSSSTSAAAAAYSSSLDFMFPSDDILPLDPEEYRLEKVLKDATTEDKTVIITTLNEAWAAPNSIIDLFLESFRIGDRTRRLLNHLVIVALDKKAFQRCLVLHSHCFALVTEDVDFSKEAYFMTPDYLKMMWRRIDFLRSVLEMGYNFVFTDADIMWFRDPFPHFFNDADFQIACDHFSGDAGDLNNRPNGGFNYVKSNNQSIEFYKYWYLSKDRYPGNHDQDVLNYIKHDEYLSQLGLKIRFLDTTYFGGLCEPSKDLNLVCTMHANCCFGMDSKVYDLGIMLQDWRTFMSLPPILKRSQGYSWRVPKNCSLHSFRQPSTTTSNKQDKSS